MLENVLLSAQPCSQTCSGAIANTEASAPVTTPAAALIEIPKDFVYDAATAAPPAENKAPAEDIWSPELMAILKQRLAKLEADGAWGLMPYKRKFKAIDKNNSNSVSRQECPLSFFSKAPC